MKLLKKCRGSRKIGQKCYNFKDILAGFHTDIKIPDVCT